MQFVVLAAGEGKRMHPLTAHRPKVMLPVAGKPLLEHLLLQAKAAGFRDVVLVTHYRSEAVREHFGTGRALGLRVSYVEQGEAGGTGHAVAAVAGHARGPFVLAYGDSLFSAADLRRLARARGLAIGAKRVENAGAYGVLTERDGRLVGLREKPGGGKPGLVNAGLYRLTSEIVEVAKGLKRSPRGEFELTDAIASAVDGPGVEVVRTDSWQDVGRPWDLLAAQERLMAGLRRRVAGHVDPSVVIEGPVVVERGARVRHHTVIEGPCIVQAGARVGPHAYIRGSTVIGPRCHVGASVEIKNSILMADTNVPHLSYVGDSVLGSRVNLGAGTNVANLKHSDRTVRVTLEDGTRLDTGRRKFGVVLGDEVKTGVNSTLNVGSVLGAGARVLPGRIVDGYVAPGAWVR